MGALADWTRDLPPLLLALWGAWLAAALVLVAWHRRARAATAAPTPSRPPARRPPSRPHPAPPAATPAPRPDAFGELQAMLEGRK